MAYFYGNTISSHWRAYGLYEVSETATAVTITLHGGFQSIGWGYDLSSVTCTVTNGGTAKSGTGDVSTGTGSTQNVRLVSNNTKTINKTTSAQTVTLKVSINRSSASYHAGTSSGSITITVPALASYGVKYYGNGSTGGSTAAQTKYYGKSLALRSNGFTRTGYSFVKWNTNSGGTGTSYNAGASYTGNAALNLYAIWKANTYAVTPNANGGTLKSGCSALTKTYGVNLTLWAASLNPTRTGYNFLGWATSPTATTPTYAAGASYTANAAATLYAVWSLAYDAPAITGLSTVRSDGTADDDEGTYLHVSFDWEVDTTDSGEVSAIRVGYRPRSTGSYTYVTMPASGTSGTVDEVLSATFAAASAYDVQVVVTDSHGMTTTKTTLLSPSFFTVDFKEGGKGVSLFGACPDDGIWVGGAQAYLCFVTSSIASFVLPTNVSNCLVLDTTDYGMYWHHEGSNERLNPWQQPISVTPNAVSCTSGSWKEICSVTVPAGVWMFFYGGGFVSNATGYRQMHFGTSLSAGRYSPSYAAASGDQTRIQGNAMDMPSGNTTYYLWARQNSGTALDFYGWIRAARIR